jgi:hypothetical protein
LAGHLAECEFCWQLAHLPEEGRETALAPGTLDRIKSVVLADLRPVTQLPSSLTLLGTLAFLFLAVLGAGAVLAGMRGWQALALPMKVSIFAPLLLGGSLLGLALVRQMIPGEGAPTRPVGWSAAVFALLVTVVSLAFGRLEQPHFLQDGLKCFRAGMVYAVSAALMVWLVVRRGAMLSGSLTGAMSGGLAGFIALAGIELRCPSPNRTHILVWHLSLVLACALGGFAVGSARRLPTRFHPRHSRAHGI